MIISVSRRTDIPAFYADWFYNRLRAGYVLVRNPMNLHSVSKVRLTADVVDAFVFWTKKPLPMARRLDELSVYPYYFQFTLTGYGAAFARYQQRGSCAMAISRSAGILRRCILRCLPVHF